MSVERMRDDWQRLALRRLAICRDDLREPVNATERAQMPGTVPYWGANAIQDYVNRAKVNQPLVLLGEDGAPFYDRNKPVAFYINEPIWPNNHIHVLFPNSNVDARWLAYGLNTVDYSTVITGSTRDKLTQGAMMSITLSVPPVGEQRAIAEYLDHETAQVDALVAKQEEFIELLQERRRAAIEQVLSKTGADRAALRHFCDLVAGTGFPVDVQGQADLELPFFKVGNLKSADRSGLLVRSEHTIDRSTARALRAAVIPKGSLVFAKVGAALLLGRVGALPDDGCLDNNMSALIFDESFDLKFARYLMLTFDFRKYVLPGPVPSLDMDGLRDFQVPVLSLDRQRAVADVLDDQTFRIDTLIAKAEEHIALAKERRSALITAAVTGQIDVRTAAQKAG